MKAEEQSEHVIETFKLAGHFKMNTHTEWEKKVIYKAIQSFSKQESIEFAKWITDNGYRFYASDDYVKIIYNTAVHTGIDLIESLKLNRKYRDMITDMEHTFLSN